MSYEDYHQGEIDKVIEALLEEHAGKLKPVEISFLKALKGQQVTYQQRDTLVAMFDRIEEGDY